LKLLRGSDRNILLACKRRRLRIWVEWERTGRVGDKKNGGRGGRTTYLGKETY